MSTTATQAMENALAGFHEETRRAIIEDIQDARERGHFHKFVFFFTPALDGSYAFWEREALGKGNEGAEMDSATENAVGVFKALGCEPDYGDTVPFSFSLNRCWWSVTYDRCIRSFGYTLPVSDDIEALARIVDDVAKGRLMMLAFEQES